MWYWYLLFKRLFLPSKPLVTVRIRAAFFNADTDLKHCLYRANTDADLKHCLYRANTDADRP